LSINNHWFTWYNDKIHHSRDLYVAILSQVSYWRPYFFFHPFISYIIKECLFCLSEDKLCVKCLLHRTTRSGLNFNYYIWHIRTDKRTGCRTKENHSSTIIFKMIPFHAKHFLIHWKDCALQNVIINVGLILNYIKYALILSYTLKIHYLKFRLMKTR